MDAAWSTCEALRHPECAGVLHSVARDVRPRGRGAVPEAGEPGVAAGARVGCRPAASAGVVASAAH